MKKGFTLAEVLITLTILGVIAALTVPNIYKNTRNRILVSQLKRAYSQVSNAVEFALVENGNKKWNRYNFKNYVAKNLKVKKDCTGTISGCMPVNNYKAPRIVHNRYSTQTNEQTYCLCNRSGKVDNNGCFYYSTKLVLDGDIIIFARDSSTLTDTNSYDVFIDVNGKKGPNQMNYDLFKFELSKRGLSPDVAEVSSDCPEYAKRVLTTNKIDY